MQRTTGTSPASPYEAVLGRAFATLDPRVQRAHLPPLVARGSLDVEHGSHPLTPLLVRLLKLPACGDAQPVRLEVVGEGAGVAWMRRIGATVLRTVQHARGNRIVERSGLGRVEFELHAVDGALEYRQVTMRIAGVPIPAFVRPQARACVSAAPGGWHVEVVVGWRRHILCRYHGVMNVA